jgi:hypothetical protein
LLYDRGGEFPDRFVTAQSEGKLAEAYVTAVVHKCEENERSKH